MSKKNRQKRRADAATKTPKKKQIPFVARPFEGLAGEQDLVAMMQILPAATMIVRLNAEHGGGDVRLVTLLPELAQALKRADGEVLVAMQTTVRSGDASRDVAAASESADPEGPACPDDSAASDCPPASAARAASTTARAPAWGSLSTMSTPAVASGPETSSACFSSWGITCARYSLRR